MIEEFLLSHCNPTICNVEWSDFKLMLEQAKAMHKEEIEDAELRGKEIIIIKHTEFGGNK